jgi:hypothetical protein
MWLLDIEPFGELAGDDWVVNMSDNYILAFSYTGESFYPQGDPILRVYGVPGYYFEVWDAIAATAWGEPVYVYLDYSYECGVCPNGSGWEFSLEDCAGIEDGPNEQDNCGICDDNPDNDCVQDCADVWGGSALFDECGVCDGPGLNDDGCCGGEVADCAGACNGTAVEDCAGECGGSSVVDECGVCGGEADGTDCNYDGVDDVCEDEYDTGYESGLLDGFDDGATSGDLNLDGFHNVSDIVLAVELILTGE